MSIREEIADVLWTNWRKLESRHQAKVFKDVDQILTRLKEELEQIENPYPEAKGRAVIYGKDYRIYEQCRKDILTSLAVEEG